MSSDKVTIFLTGATGYIGGSVLQRLLDHPDRKNFEITALVRNVEKAKRLDSEFGVKTVVGALQDLDKLTALAENAHVVIHTANCDDLDAINAILCGLKARHEKTGDVPLLIHTSGTGEFMDDARGACASDKVYSDLDIAGIEALPPTAVHRPVDVTIVAADVAGFVRTHIIMPSVIYGVASGPLFDAGISNPQTIIIPLYVRGAVINGHVALLNEGATYWGDVHVTDMVEMYIRLFDTLRSTPEKVSHGRDGYFIAENGEFTARECLQTIADALFSLGRISSPKLVQYSDVDIGQYYSKALPATVAEYGGQMIARVAFANTRCKAERACRELGWTPTHMTKDLLAGLPYEAELVVKKIDMEKST